MAAVVSGSFGSLSRTHNADRFGSREPHLTLVVEHRRDVHALEVERVGRIDGDRFVAGAAAVPRGKLRTACYIPTPR